MIRRSIFATIVFSFALVIFALATSTQSFGFSDKKKKAKIRWATFDEGLRLAKKENKILVVDFYTDWCHWCKVMEQETYGNKDVIAYARDNAVMARMNAETSEKFEFRDASYSGRELTMMFGVTGFPATVFISPEGELITTVPGFIQAGKFKLIMKYLASKRYEKMNFDEFVQKEKQKNKS